MSTVSCRYNNLKDVCVPCRLLILSSIGIIHVNLHNTYMSLLCSFGPVVHEIWGKNAHIKWLVGEKLQKRSQNSGWTTPALHVLQKLTLPSVIANSFLYVGDKVRRGIYMHMNMYMYSIVGKSHEFRWLAFRKNFLVQYLLTHQHASTYIL